MSSVADFAADVIVIGSGAGGAAAAWQLVRSGVRVLLLEKGADLPRDGSTLDVDRVVRRGEFLAREPWIDGQGRTVIPEEHFNIGGKTRWYGAALLRFAAAEFAADPQFQCRGWPIGLEDLRPYYEAAEQLLGVRELAIEPDLRRIVDRVARPGQPWRVAAMPMGLAPHIGEHREEAMHFDGFASVLGLKADAQRSMLSMLSGDERLRLVSNAEVTGLLSAPGNSRFIAGVKLDDGREFRAPRVVLAAGALHSPRLLARYLKAADLDAKLAAAANIGRNLKLHILTAMVAFSPRKKTDLIRKTALLTHDRFAHSTVQPLGFDAELIATLMPGYLPRAVARGMAERAYGFFLQTEDGSDRDNAVYEQSTAGGLQRVLDYDASRLQAAAQEHRLFTHALQRSLLGAGMLAITRRIGLAGTAHACGSLVCGSDPADSVVAADGRVHGMQGIYVADGSILPRISRVNPALTIYAWALRLGTLIARDVTSERALSRLAIGARQGELASEWNA